LNLVGRPLSPADVLIKRSFDIVISAGALVLLSSLFLIMAILIKLDSPGSGPVLTASLRFQTGAVPDRKVPYDDDARRRSSRHAYERERLTDHPDRPLDAPLQYSMNCRSC
jgi:hypothetical protein